MRLEKQKELGMITLLSLILSSVWIFTLRYFLYFSQPQSIQKLDTDAIIQYYDEKFFEFLPFIILPIFLFTFLCLYAIAKLSKMILQKDLLSKIRKANEKKEEVFYQEEDIVKLFKQLQEQYITQIMDTKRLNSYISHEQKNELAVLKALLSDYEDKAAHESITHLQNNLEDILTLCDASENLTVLDSAEICATVCDSFQATYPNLHFSFDEDANLMMYGKERWLRRAISNLLHNAIKYGEGKDIHVSLSNHNQSVQIVVRDNGIGMEESYLSEIMKFGYQIAHAKNDGYGIGLNLVHHVCKLCGGFIWIESEKKNGTSVYLSFPQAM